MEPKAHGRYGTNLNYNKEYGYRINTNAEVMRDEANEIRRQIYCHSLIP